MPPDPAIRWLRGDLTRPDTLRGLPQVDAVVFAPTPDARDEAAYRAVFFDAEFGLIEDTRVEATLLGRRVESFDDDIKAITYHGAGFRRNGDGQYETEVIFDI